MGKYMCLEKLLKRSAGGNIVIGRKQSVLKQDSRIFQIVMKVSFTEEFQNIEIFNEGKHF